ncbi:MAG: 1-deoxy-D-xylulose-5-phosphate synthase [Bacteroidales bacterium]|nr:1-deoxy-D-xylulose-5-phosphate synthase [Candidatus Physcousia equi]
MTEVNDTTTPLLDKINLPDDLRKVDEKLLPQVCNELRLVLIQELSNNPGHFASSLGVVELTVALHYVFNTPEDRIVWDVGHQAYAHKLLTGRREQFHTNRKLGGLHPFPTPAESPYDTFTCGHASNSISAALGMAVADSLSESKRKVVAVIGDGSMSGGLAFEGLNNTSSTPNDMLIVLNDNNMSIDRSVGGLKHYLHHLHTGQTYNNLRNRTAQRLMQWGWITEERRKQIISFNNAMKSLLNNQHNIFEGMNIRYFGPYDGHNVTELVRALRNIKDMKGPKILHIHTKKGKGYEPAEQNATIWHAPGKFNPETGERVEENDSTRPPRYQDVFGHTLLELAHANPHIVGITPAMPTGCSLNIMMQEMPERTFDVGIAEGHAVTFAGGLAKEGMLPFCNIYSAFAQRAYDNIIHDVALEHLNVVFCFDRAGLVGEDGATHHGAFDLAALRPIPGLTICSPLDDHELRHMMFTAQQPHQGPFVIRYPRGRAEHTDWQCEMKTLEVGRGRCLKEGSDVAVLTLGPLGNMAARAIRKAEARAEAERKSLSVAHYDMRFLKPIDEELLHLVGSTFRHIITIEDGARKGGLGSAVLEFMADNRLTPHVTRLGIPDNFVEHGTVAELHHIVGLDENHVVECIMQNP